MDDNRTHILGASSSMPAIGNDFKLSGAGTERRNHDDLSFLMSVPLLAVKKRAVTIAHGTACTARSANT
jgi:hypothetical protein